jgi:hypothetical protein
VIKEYQNSLYSINLEDAQTEENLGRDGITRLIVYTIK